MRVLHCNSGIRGVPDAPYSLKVHQLELGRGLQAAKLASDEAGQPSIRADRGGGPYLR